MKVFDLENAIRCDCCGIIIGDYYHNKVINTKYKYPIIYRHDGRIVILDISCYLGVVTGSIKPIFDARYDPMIIAPVNI